MRSSAEPQPTCRPDTNLLRRIYLPRAADAVASAMTTYGIPLLVLAATSSASLTGLAFALEWTPRLLAFALAGGIVDRYGTSQVFRLASVARALVVLAAALALPAQTSGAVTTVTVMLLAASSGMLTEFSYIAAETAGAASSSAAGAHDAHRVQSVLFGIDQIATLTGPALAAVLLASGGPAGMLITVAAFSLLAAVLAPRQPLRTATTRVPMIKGLYTGWTTLRSLPALAWLVTGLVVSNLAVGLLQAAAPVIVVKELGHSSTDVGLVWSAAAVASLSAVTACRTAIDRWGLWPVGAVSATIAAGATLAVAQAHTYGSYLVLIAILMAGEGGMTVVLRTLRSHLIPTGLFGSTLSLTILLLLLPFPLAGILLAAVPPQSLGHVITGCAILQASALAAAFIRLRSLNGLRPPHA